MRINIVKQLANLSNKVYDAETAFYRAAENYLRFVILKQKEEKIDLHSASIVLFEKYSNPVGVDSTIKDLKYLYFDVDVSIAAGGYDYLLSDLDMGSVHCLVNWVKNRI